MLHLEGFDGPMDLLLDLAERQRIDWGRMSILALAEQFVAALEQLADRVPIERRADWLVMATRFVLLRSRLLFPDSPVAAEAAQRDAAAELQQIDDLAEVRAVAAWLGDRAVLDQDVFARGAPDRLGVYVELEDEADVIAFLWASLALFEDDAEQLDTVARYRPAWTDLYSFAEARDRILRLLGEGGDGEALGYFLPEQPAITDAGDPPADPAAPLFRLGHHLQRQPGAGQAWRCRLGPDRSIRVCPSQPPDPAGAVMSADASVAPFDRLVDMGSTQTADLTRLLSMAVEPSSEVAE